MDSWITVRYDGEKPMTVDHRRMTPGETREVSASRWRALQEEHPGLFSGPGQNDGKVEANELETLGLKARVRETLEAVGVTSVVALREMDDEALLAIGGIGPGTLAQIREKLREIQETADSGAGKE